MRAIWPHAYRLERPNATRFDEPFTRPAIEVVTSTTVGAVDAGPDEIAAGTGDNPLVEIERWFVVRGLPHFIERSNDEAFHGAWNRALPILVGAYLLLGLNALDLANWTLVENLLAALFVVATLIVTWVLSNRLRGRPSFARPQQIDRGELLLFLLGPAIPVLAFGQFFDALQTVLLGAALLALIYLWSSYGIGPMLRWGARRGQGQLTGLGPLVARALPLLLLFTTFLFINGEVWQIAGTLDGIPYVLVILIFFGLGATFILTRVPGYIRQENRFASWTEIEGYLADTPATTLELPTAEPVVDPLTRRQRFNIGLIVIFGQALQITLVVAVLTAFFVLFGVLAIPADTIAGWTAMQDLNVLFDFEMSGRTLVLTEPLIRVSVFLGAFAGMYFTVVLSTDDIYRDEFAEDVGPEIRQALAVREAYRVERGTYPAVGSGTECFTSDDPGRSLPTGQTPWPTNP
jgi:hypothetical protein